MIEIFVVGCVMTIALFLAVFERKDDVKGDEVVSTGPGYWTIPDSEQKYGDTSSGSSDESDLESEPEKQQQIATQDCASVLQLRLHRFGEYRTRKEVNDLLILLVYYYTVIIKILGVLLANQGSERSSIGKNVPTITLYKEEEDYPLDDELSISSSKKKAKDDKQAEDVVMPICLRKNDEAMYHEASIDNLDVLIAQRRKIETYISRLSESDVDISRDVPAKLEEQPRITDGQSDVSFKVSIGKKGDEDPYKQLTNKADITSEIESLQSKLGEAKDGAKDGANNELESLKTKLGYDLSPKLKHESSIDSDCSMPTLKSISIDESDLDLSSSQHTESEVLVTEVEVFPDKDSTITINQRMDNVEKVNEQKTVDQEPVHGNSYHTGAIPKYSHVDTGKATANSQTASFQTPVIKVENFREPEKISCNPDSLICESKPIDTHATSKAEIIKIKPIEKDILDGSDEDDIDIDDSEESDVSVTNMKGSYTLHHEDFGDDEIYEDKDPLAFLMEQNESEEDLPENFVDQFFSDESIPCAPVSDKTYQIDPILEEESDETSSIHEKDIEPVLQLKVPSLVPTVIEDKFAMTFSQAVDDDDNIDQNTLQVDDKVAVSDIVEEKHNDQNTLQVDDKVAASDIVEEKHIDVVEPDKNIHIFPNGNDNMDQNTLQVDDKVAVSDIVEEKDIDVVEPDKNIHSFPSGNDNIDQNTFQVDDKVAVSDIVEEKHIDQNTLQVDNKVAVSDIVEEKHIDVVEPDKNINSFPNGNDNIDQNTLQVDGKVAVSYIVEEKHNDVVEPDKTIHSFPNGNMHKEVLHKIKDLADKLDEIKKQELNVDCVIVEDITEDVITVETESQLKKYVDEPYSSKLDQCKAFNAEDNLEAEEETDVLKSKEGIELNDSNDLSGSEKKTSVKEDSVLHKIAEDENLNNIQNLVNKSTTDQNDQNISNLDKSFSLFTEDNDTNAKDDIKYGTQETQANDEFSSDFDQSQYFNMNQPIEIVKGINEIAEDSLEINDTFDHIEMAYGSLTPDMDFEYGDSAYENIDDINGNYELSVRNNEDSPYDARVHDKQYRDTNNLENNQRTSSVIKSLVSDKSEPLKSEQESVLSETKGEEVLLDLSVDQDCSAIDRCVAFSADIEPPEDFDYEGETVYQKTVRLENFKNLENLQSAVVSSDECNHKIVLDVHEFRHGDLRVSAVGETEILVEAVSEVPEHEAMEIRRFRQKFLLPDTAAANDSIAALSSDGVLAIITPKKDGTTPSIKRKLPEDVETPEKSSKYMTKHDPRSNETEKSTIIDREMVECFLPILQRGNFFTDSIFQETRQDFNTAITEVLDKWGDRSVHDPQRGTQREEPNEDNQVMVITDDENNTRKILVDIADFTDDGEVKINVMDEELVVEGRSKKAEGGATSVKTFIRRFTLAPDIDPSAVTSVVTPDRILEITTPKKAVIPKLKEFSIQVIIELIVEESRTSPRKDSKTRKKLKDKSPAKDTSSSHSKKKKKVHPEDVKTQDKNQQDAKLQMDNTQELMTKSCEPEALAASSMDMSEDNRNKVLDDIKGAEMSSKSHSKPSENSIEDYSKEQSSSVLKDSRDATKQKQNKQKEKSKKTDKLKSSNDLKHDAELDDGKDEVSSLNKQEDVISKQLNDNHTTNQGLEDDKNVNLESVDESSIVKKESEESINRLVKTNEKDSKNKNTTKEPKVVEQDESDSNKLDSQSTDDATQMNKKSKEDKKKVTKKSKSINENENEKANEDIQEALKQNSNSTKNNLTSEKQSKPEELQNATKERQAISKLNDESSKKAEASKQETEENAQNATLNVNKDSQQGNKQNIDGNYKKESQDRYDDNEQSINASKVIDITDTGSKESQQNIVSSAEQSGVLDGRKDLSDKNDKVVETANKQLDTTSNKSQGNERGKDIEITASNDSSFKISNEGESTDGQNQILNSESLNIQNGLKETDVATNAKLALHENTNKEVQDLNTATKQNLENIECFQDGSSKDKEEDLSLKNNSTENNSTSNKQSLPEDLQKATKDKKKDISKSNNESHITGDTSKQSIEENTQKDILNLNKDSHQLNKQNIEGSNKEDPQKKYEEAEQNTDTNKTKDITKDTSLELQENIVSSTELPSVSEVIKDLNDKDKQVVKTANEQVNTIPNDAQGNEKIKKAEITATKDPSGKIPNEVDRTDGQNQDLNSDASKIQNGLKETEVATNENLALHENISQKLQNVSIESKENLESFQADSNDTKKGEVNEIESFTQKDKNSQGVNKTKDQFTDNSESSQLETTTNDTSDKKHKEHTQTQETTENLPMQHSQLEEASEVRSQEVSSSSKAEKPHTNEKTEMVLNENNKQVATQEISSSSEPNKAQENLLEKDEKLKISSAETQITKEMKEHAQQAEVEESQLSKDNSKQQDLSSDDAKSLEAQAVSKKESKASDKEGLKDKLAAASECATEVSEASVDKTTKDSEGVKPSAKSQPDIQQNDKETKSQASSQKSKKKQTAQDEDSKLLSSEAEMDALTKSKSTTKQQEIATADGSAAFDQKSPKGKKELDTAGIPVAGEQKSTTEQQDHATADGSVVIDQKSPRNQQELDTAGIPITGEQKSNTEKQNLATADSSVDKTTKDSEGVKPSAKSQSDIQQNDKETKKASSQKSKKKQTAQDEASKLLSSETEMDALSKSKSTTKQQELATADGSAAFDQKSPKDQKELDTTGIPVTGEQKSTIEQQQLVTADSSAAFDKKSTEDQKELNTAGSPAAGEQNQKSPKDQKELDTAGIPVTGEQQSTTEQQQLATADSSVAFDQKSPKDQKELSTAGSPADGKQNQKSSKDQKELDTTGIPVTGEQKATTEQLQLATADSSVALDKTSSKGKKELNTTGSPAAGEQKSTTEQPDLSTVDGSIALDQKSPTKQQELDTAGIPTTGEQKSNIEQQNLATAESSVVLDQKSAKDKKELDTAGIPVTGEQKSTTEQQQLATAKSSVDFDQKSPKDQKDLDTTGSPVTGEQKTTTAQHELETAKNSQSIEDQLKSTSTANISQPKSKQSASEDGVKTELLSSQQVEKELKSTVQKSAKEDTTKVASDESVKPKKSTVKKDVSEKQDTESHKNTSTSKLDIQSSTSSRRKEEEKSISTKDAKALFQSQAASATGSTSDLRSTGSGSGSGLSGARFKSTSYSQLPGSSSPSSGYLATGTKTISTGSFTFKATEEYIKKKPPPRNRPFFNLRDFL